MNLRKYEKFEHLSWPLDSLKTFSKLTSAHANYPIRFLRYWFVRMILERHHTQLGRALRVLEVGIGDGRMLAFMGGRIIDDRQSALPSWIERWDAFDVQAHEDVLRRYSYSDCQIQDVERPFELLHRPYDAIVLLHVLEHLFSPENAMFQLAKGLAPGGILTGGSPTMPEALSFYHQFWLRRKYRSVSNNPLAHRHLSVISPSRIRRFAKRSGYSIELLTGAFLCRWSDVFLENHVPWVRSNLLWGALAPALGGEIYFSIRNIL